MQNQLKLRSDCRFLKLNEQRKSTLPQNFKSNLIFMTDRLEIVKNHGFALRSGIPTFSQPEAGRQRRVLRTMMTIMKKRHKKKEQMKEIKMNQIRDNVELMKMEN